MEPHVLAINLTTEYDWFLMSNGQWVCPDITKQDGEVSDREEVEYDGVEQDAADLEQAADIGAEAEGDVESDAVDHEESEDDIDVDPYFANKEFAKDLLHYNGLFPLLQPTSQLFREIEMAVLKRDGFLYSTLDVPAWVVQRMPPDRLYLNSWEEARKWLGFGLFIGTPTAQVGLVAPIGKLDADWFPNAAPPANKRWFSPRRAGTWLAILGYEPEEDVVRVWHPEFGSTTELGVEMEGEIGYLPSALVTDKLSITLNKGLDLKLRVFFPFIHFAWNGTKYIFIGNPSDWE
jgi:hypothetical protein